MNPKWRSPEELYAIAAHMLTDVAITPPAERHDRIGEWARQMKGDQQAWLVGAAFELSLVTLDTVASASPQLQQAIDQMLANGVAAVQPLPPDFPAPNRLPEI